MDTHDAKTEYDADMVAAYQRTDNLVISGVPATQDEAMGRLRIYAWRLARHCGGTRHLLQLGLDLRGFPETLKWYKRYDHQNAADMEQAYNATLRALPGATRSFLDATPDIGAALGLRVAMDRLVEELCSIAAIDYNQLQANHGGRTAHRPQEQPTPSTAGAPKTEDPEPLPSGSSEKPTATPNAKERAWNSYTWATKHHPEMVNRLKPCQLSSEELYTVAIHESGYYNDDQGDTLRQIPSFDSWQRYLRGFKPNMCSNSIATEPHNVASQRNIQDRAELTNRWRQR